MEDFSALIDRYKARSTLHAESGVTWVHQLVDEVGKHKPLPLLVRKKLRDFAEQIYNDDLRGQGSRPNYSSSLRKNILTHGTTRDKIAAYTLQCIDNPLYSLKDLQSLIEFVDPKVKTQRLDAIGNLLNVFKNAFLPDRYVAREFECHDFQLLIPLVGENPEQVEKQLLLWYFEDHVRLAFLNLVNNLERVCHDAQLKTKSQGIKGLQHLITNHPKQDTEIVLSKLINKLGDSNRRVAGEINHILSSLQMTHPHLKVALVSLVEELLYRPNVSFRTQYYGLCFLKDIIFKKTDHSLVEKLVKLYFDFFKTCSQKGEVDSRFMAAILRGLNRAYPYLANRGGSFLEEQLVALYTISHKVQFNVATQALQLIYKITSGPNQESSDRFYNALYEKLLDQGYGPGSSLSAFLNLVFKAMSKDTNPNRVCAFVRRLLQVSAGLPSQVVCGILFLVSEVIKDNPCFAGLEGAFLPPTETGTAALKIEDDSEDDNECYADLDTDGEDDKEEEEVQENNDSNSVTLNAKESMIITKGLHVETIRSEPSWLHRNIPEVKTTSQVIRTDHYIPTHRNPSYCGAHLSPIWELLKLGSHYHPSASLFASTLLHEEDIKYSGDPLEDFTLIRFLDRFIHRNPKKDHKTSRSSEILGNRSNYQPVGARRIPVESERFRNLAQSQVPVEDLFVYKYFTCYGNKKKGREKIDNDTDSVSDEEFEGYLKRRKDWKHLGFNEDEVDNFDFAKNVQRKAKGWTSDLKELDELEDDVPDEDADDDVANDEDGEDDFDLGDSDDAEDLSFSDDSKDSFDDPKNKVRGKKLKKKKSGRWDDLLVDADEFSHLLESADAGDLAGTSEQVFNRDKSHGKQFMWEAKRRRDSDKSFRDKGFTKSSLKKKGSRNAENEINRNYELTNKEKRNVKLKNKGFENFELKKKGNKRLKFKNSEGENFRFEDKVKRKGKLKNKGNKVLKLNEKTKVWNSKKKGKKNLTSLNKRN